MQHLQYFWLHGNKLSNLFPYTFKGLQKLRGIYGLQADELPEEIFHNLTSLKELHLSTAQRVLTENLFDGLILRTVSLTGINLTDVPEKLFAPVQSHIENIALTVPNIQFFSLNVFSGLYRLKAITVVGPKQFIGNRFSKQDILSIASISLHGVSTLMPSIFYGLNNIQHLDISNNPNALDSIPPDFFPESEQLKFLDLSGNFLSTLSLEAEESVLEGLYYLQTLNLSNNNIVSLGTEDLTPVMDTLEMLDLSRNQLQYLQNDTLITYNLQYLNLSNNRLRELEYDVFNQLENLKLLNLENNELSYLPHSLLAENTYLEYISLANNHIDVIHSQLFESNSQLRFVKLSGNNFVTLPPDLFMDHAALSLLALDNNPISCGCNVSAFIVWRDEFGALIEGQCASPPMFRGKLLNFINEDMICAQITKGTETTQSSKHTTLDYKHSTDTLDYTTQPKLPTMYMYTKTEISTVTTTDKDIGWMELTTELHKGISKHSEQPSVENIPESTTQVILSTFFTTDGKTKSLTKTTSIPPDDWVKSTDKPTIETSVQDKSPTTDDFRHTKKVKATLASLATVEKQEMTKILWKYFEYSSKRKEVIQHSTKPYKTNIPYIYTKSYKTTLVNSGTSFNAKKTTLRLKMLPKISTETKNIGKPDIKHIGNPNTETKNIGKPDTHSETKNIGKPETETKNIDDQIGYVEYIIIGCSLLLLALIIIVLIYMYWLRRSSRGSAQITYRP